MEQVVPGARICCLDLDTFFVSVERLLDPELVGKPVVVGASPGKRGVVTAASYEVRAFGVRSGMPISEAVRLAPDAVFLPCRHGVYGPYAAEVREILERYTPSVQTASIDEFFLDFRGCERLWRRREDPTDEATIERVVRQMRQTIHDEVGLPASAGIGSTRSIAKIASGKAKPAGVHLVPAGAEQAFVRPLPVRAFPGIGPATEARLHARGIHTVGDLLAVPPGPLRARFGGLAASVTRSIDPTRRSPLGRDRPAFREHDDPGHGSVGSISNERTFHADVSDIQRVLDQLRSLAERVSWRARQRGVLARTVTLKLRTSDFHTVTRGLTAHGTHHEAEIHRRLLTLLPKAWSREQAVRLIGVALSNFDQPGNQLALPLAVRHRPSVGGAIDAVRERFGYDAIRLGATGSPTQWIA
ncbi:MAG: DNA polymerase IV [Myxococcales bacterium]|nr:DNA polymerase IV [Myxococcales bacterium]